MPPKLSDTAAKSIWNLTSLLASLPTATRSSAFTKCSACLFSTSPALELKQKKRGRKKKLTWIDPYRTAQAKQRKAANQAKQKTLKAQREASLGDPLYSRSTPFIESLKPTQAKDAIEQAQIHNYHLDDSALQAGLQYSRSLTRPPRRKEITTASEQEPIERPEIRVHQQLHENASLAITNIASIENSNSSDRKRINVQRCIEEFGRHNTDRILPPKLPSLQETARGAVVPRAGRDTGSSEVQAAILTAKINIIAGNLHNKDKMNKRNLRLMVHQRQKHLNYLRRKERGGPRWENLVQTLGINDAMWKGEISL